MYISSLTNAKVKDWMRLYQKKYRKDIGTAGSVGNVVEKPQRR